MNLDHNFFQVSKLSEEQKKKKKNGLHIKWNTFFSPNSGEDQKKKVFTKNGTLVFPEFKWRPALRCTPESNYWGDANVDHTQIIGGYIPPSPPYQGLAPLTPQTFIDSNYSAVLQPRTGQFSRT